MEFVILGLLLLRDLTQYEIKSILERKVSPFYSASLGSIQAALKKLESGGHADRQEVVQGGRRKLVYAISDEGKRHFLDWMKADVPLKQLDKEVTTRLFFLGLLAAEDRVRVVEAVIGTLEAGLRDFEAAGIAAGSFPVPDALTAIAKYQFRTLELGLHFHRSMLSWFQSLLREMKEEEGLA